ncbi:MAG TPA: DUF4185 domain-containing protein [Gemmatimonadaceae bacterium]|nr:DUF4185 domain-containing protein [Gemmatimonadaceae bacterium]
MHRTARTIALLLCLGIVPGCGGGSEPAGPKVEPTTPTIASFTAAASRITSDQGTTLTWSVSGAQSVSIAPGIGVVTGTSVAVSPTVTTTYTLTATSASGGSATATTAVTVTAGVAGITLAFNPGTTVKLEQVIGDKDWASAAKGTTLPTASLTSSRYGVFGTDIGSSFEHNGKVLFLFGDTRAENPAVNLGAADPIAFSSTTDGDAPLMLDFYTQNNGSTLWVNPPGIDMAGHDVPNAGVSLSDGLYLVLNTGAEPTQADIHANASSVLVRFDEASKTFTPGRTISTMPSGHFLYTALGVRGTDVYMFGTGKYRESNIYLSRTPASGFWAGTGTQYFAGRVNGQPTWTTSESGAVPIVQDNPPTGTPTIGNVAVAYSADLGMWLMTYDGGRQSVSTRGIYLAYAKDPWGPWATPVMIYNIPRDPGLGLFIHNPSAVPSDGLNGPVIGPNDPATTPGGPYAPSIIGRFTRVTGNTLKVYFLLSTWNPYTVVKMRSELTISRP